jgi:glycosyltransferase involved in cell wall biosynthesis
MRICFLGDGRTHHTQNWTQYFAALGHQVDLISVEGVRFEPLENVTVHTIPAKFPDNIKFLSHIVKVWLGPFINAYRIRGLVRSIRPDILHAHYLTTYGFVGFLLHFPKYVVTIWGSDILVTPKTSWYHRLLAKSVLGASDLVTCDSEAARDACLLYCNQPEKVKVVLWGVDLSTFQERADDHRDHTPVTILSTRHFNPVYNIDTIIRSIPRVAEKYPGVKYLLKAVLIEQKDELEHLAASLEVTERIEIVCGNIPYPELPKFLYRGDIFISVPSSDSSSISLLEAMACGLPVIVSDIPANHEWITDGWNGLIVPVRDPAKLADAIITLAQNPELRQLFGRRNARIIRDRADRRNHMAHMEELYRKLLTA